VNYFRLKAAIGALLFVTSASLLTGCSSLHEIAGMGSKPPAHPISSSVAKVAPKKADKKVEQVLSALDNKSKHKANPVTPVTHKLVIEPSVFAAGSVTHVVHLGGGVSAVLEYYTSQNPSNWKHNTPANITLSAKLAGLKSDVEAQVKGFRAVLTCGDTASATVVQKNGNYTIDYPWAYNAVIPVQCGVGHSATVQIELDIAAETYEDSGVFFAEPPALDKIHFTFPGDAQ
jgi:hypothetical protein